MDPMIIAIIIILIIMFWPKIRMYSDKFYDKLKTDERDIVRDVEDDGRDIMRDVEDDNSSQSTDGVQSSEDLHSQGKPLARKDYVKARFARRMGACPMLDQAENETYHFAGKQMA